MHILFRKNFFAQKETFVSRFRLAHDPHHVLEPHILDNEFL